MKRILLAVLITLVSDLSVANINEWSTTKLIDGRVFTFKNHPVEIPEDREWSNIVFDIYCFGECPFTANDDNRIGVMIGSRVHMTY
ncbi:hypothetical protein RFH42_05555 [Acinetobacter rudis]|uniref:hypothetical protein n=1 Tax=Acinetobacter rudis TaxID=632955 RepID=UPI00280FF6E2|nr:hypothetical protein [Acinetobacter rudis]MDQ8952428.1 hypothetical protein [Acinetobacter rudis]